MIHSSADARTLGLVRAVVFGLWFVLLAFDPFEQIALLPVEAFEPYGVLRLIPTGAWPHLLTEPVLLGVRLALLGVTFAAAFGLRGYPIFATIAAVLLTFHEGAARGFAHINHAQLPLLYMTYVLAVFPAADGFVRSRGEGRGRKEHYVFAMRAMMIIVLFAYTTIGLYRITQSSPEIFLSESMLYSIGKNTHRASFYGMQWGTWVLEYRFLLPVINLGYFIVTLFEVLSVFCLVSRPFRWMWLLVMVGFHLSTLFLMNLLFWHNLILCVLLFFEWGPLLQRLTQRLVCFR